MTSSLQWLYFLSLLFAALALVPSGAHLLELANKIRLPAEHYRIVQQIYRGWALAGVLVVAALVASLLLAIALRDQSGKFYPALVALCCIALTQVIFWTFTYPVNRRTKNWTALPADWIALRRRWEYSHAATAILTVAAIVALVVSVLRPA